MAVSQEIQCLGEYWLRLDRLDAGALEDSGDVLGGGLARALFRLVQVQPRQVVSGGPGSAREPGGRAYRAKAASGQLPAGRPPDQPEAKAGKAQVATPTAQGLVAGFMAMIVIGAALGALVSPGDDSAVGTSS